jgi:hypothetical protein
LDNNYEFEQFTMFNFKEINNDIFYWDNALSYSNDLPKFIELIDNSLESYDRISKWENGIKKVNINNLKKSTGIDLLDKRTLYISNSITMAFEMCFEKYCELKNINKNEYLIDFNNITIQKNNQTLAIDLNTKFAFYIISYINDDYQNNEILLLKNNISIKPKAGSVLIIPASELGDYKINDVIGTRYTASTVIYSNLEAQN